MVAETNLEGCMKTRTKSERRKLLSEDQVKNAVIANLASIGYMPTKIKTLREHGVDITARHHRYPRYFLVEVKGDPPQNVKSSRSGREVRFLQSLGQLITRIQPERGYYYGLAFPSSYRDTVTRRLHPALLKKLHLHLFFVNGGLGVEHVRWRDLAGSAARR
jgi:hypothetical protein